MIVSVYFVMITWIVDKSVSVLITFYYNTAVAKRNKFNKK